MTGVAAGLRWRRDARALRFLLILLGSWTIVRVMAHWSPALPPKPPGMPYSPWERGGAPAPWDATAAEPLALAVLEAAVAASGHTSRRAWRLPVDDVVRDATPSGDDRGEAAHHSLRLALMARLLPALPGRDSSTALPPVRASWLAAPELGRTAPPGGGRPYWMRRQLAGWSLGTWAYGRGGAGPSSGGIAAAGQLGGSQAGARLSFGFGDSGRLRVYGRATLALAELRQRELAFGFAFAPAAHLPVDVAIEQRLAVGSQGRTALAAFVSGGVGDVMLPQRFRLEAYGQAGIVGARRRDGFADAAVVVDREVGRIPQASVHIGALAAGSVQPGVARVDVGPRLTVRLPQVGEGSRVALDWRQRVAGDARPDSGLALTLAADF